MEESMATPQQFMLPVTVVIQVEILHTTTTTITILLLLLIAITMGAILEGTVEDIPGATLEAILGVTRGGTQGDIVVGIVAAVVVVMEEGVVVAAVEIEEG